MASHGFNAGAHYVLQNGLASADIRFALLMTNTTADTENDGIAFVDDLATLDESNGANYVRKAAASETFTKDDTNDRSELDVADVTWTALGDGDRGLAGILYYAHVTNDSDSVPLWWEEFGSEQDPGGANFSMTINAEGLLQLQWA